MNKTMKKALGVTLCLAMVGSMSLSTSAAELVAADMGLLGPVALAMDEDGTLYVVDEKNNNIVMVEEDSLTLSAGYTLPGDYYGIPTGGYYDGSAESSLFSKPSDMIFWNDGYVVSDTGNNVLRYVVDGAVTTLAGSGEAGDSTGTGTNASFYLPRGLAVDDAGTLYVADSGNGSIKTVSSTGVVKNYVTGLVAPYGLYFFDDVLYVTDAGTNQIYTVVNGKAEVLTGVAELDEDEYLGGYVDGDISVAEFCFPQGIFVDSTGIYVADTGNDVVRKITDTTVTTVFSAADGDGTWPSAPNDVLVDDGSLYIAGSFAGIVAVKDLVGAQFLDMIENSWWTDSAKTMIYLGLMNGVSDTAFAPNTAMTREMAVTILYRYDSEVLENDSALADLDFTDVADDMWYSDAIAWAVSAGIVTGQSEDSFGLGQSISRQDLVTMLYRYQLSLDAETEATGDLRTFADGENVSDYAVEAMTWAVGEGIITGLTTDSIAPFGATTRAQMAVLFDRFMGL